MCPGSTLRDLGRPCGRGAHSTERPRQWGSFHWCQRHCRGWARRASATRAVLALLVLRQKRGLESAQLPETRLRQRPQPETGCLQESLMRAESGSRASGEGQNTVWKLHLRKKESSVLAPSSRALPHCWSVLESGDSRVSFADRGALAKCMLSGWTRRWFMFLSWPGLGAEPVQMFSGVSSSSALQLCVSKRLQGGRLGVSGGACSLGRAAWPRTAWPFFGLTPSLPSPGNACSFLHRSPGSD